MVQFVEGIINFSEGRRIDVIEKIIDEVRSTPGAIILDYSHDEDHNRSVVTFMGDLEAVGEASFKVASKAAELIDMEKHQGGHPRIGAVDVIPFVPASGVSMEECVELARVVGKRIGEELKIPVYLYGEAAAVPERRSLPYVRRGQYEGLKESIRLPERAPDFGPAVMHPTAGAVAVGARPPLVAFNVNLDTADLDIAKKIAAAVREKTGGLKNVRAIGLKLKQRNQAQISMNLVNCDETPIYLTLELVRIQASRYGTRVVETEIIGLCPQRYLFEALRYYMQMPSLSEEQILELRIFRKWGVINDAAGGSFD
jgi:glutamate formiminotransferase / 5-formyltetrahydrofolate cyclo-ligase